MSMILVGYIFAECQQEILMRKPAELQMLVQQKLAGKDGRTWVGLHQLFGNPQVS